MYLAARTCRYIAILLGMATIMATLGCSGPDNRQASSLSASKYVAMLEVIDDQASVIEGTCTLPVPSPLPPYPFNYDSSKGSISLNTPANASLKILYGSRHDRLWPWLLIYDLKSCGIYELPYKCESGPVITDVDGNGTIYLTWENQSITLKPGDKWRRESGPEIRVINISGYSPFTARFVTVTDITNLGVFDKPRDQ